MTLLRRFIVSSSRRNLVEQAKAVLCPGGWFPGLPPIRTPRGALRSSAGHSAYTLFGTLYRSTRSACLQAGPTDHSIGSNPQRKAITTHPCPTNHPKSTQIGRSPYPLPPKAGAPELSKPNLIRPFPSWPYKRLAPPTAPPSRNSPPARAHPHSPSFFTRPESPAAPPGTTSRLSCTRPRSFIHPALEYPSVIATTNNAPCHIGGAGAGISNHLHPKPMANDNAIAIRNFIVPILPLPILHHPPPPTLTDRSAGPDSDQAHQPRQPPTPTSPLRPASAPASVARRQSPDHAH